MRIHITQVEQDNGTPQVFYSCISVYQIPLVEQDNATGFNDILLQMTAHMFNTMCEALKNVILFSWLYSQPSLSSIMVCVLQIGEE